MSEHDPLLAEVVARAEQGAHAQMVMIVGGTMLSGTIIPPTDFTEALTGQFAGLTDATGEQPRWVHLKGVTMGAPGAAAAHRDYWRVRLDAVQGWQIGEPAQPRQSPPPQKIQWGS